MAVNVTFGHWHNLLGFLDYNYNGIVSKLINLAKEAGIDKYGRQYDFEPLVDFAISHGITDRSADYIYRHYSYNLIEEKTGVPVDIEEEELLNALKQFCTL